MYIKNRSASALYKLFISIIALVGFWVSLMSFGLSAWRLFSTYILLLTALYLLTSALVIALSKNRNPGRVPCIMLEGMIIVSLTLLCVSTIVCRLQNITIPSANGWHASLIYFVVPFLVLSDWVLFARKGRWRLIDPFYWISPAVIYASLILLTADSLPQDSLFRYPLPFLNYPAFGVIDMLEWFIVVGVLSLTYGYALVAIDFAASGKVSRYVVLPRLKTVVEEEPPHEQPVKTAESVIERIEVKLEPMETPKAKSTSKPASKAAPSSKPKQKAQNTRPKVQDIKPSASSKKQSQEHKQPQMPQPATKKPTSPKPKPVDRPSETKSVTHPPKAAPKKQTEPKSDAPKTADTGKATPAATEKPKIRKF